MEIHDIILAVVTLLSVIFGSGGAIAYFRLRDDLRKLEAETHNTEAQTTKTQAESWLLLVEAQRHRLDQLNAKVESLENRLTERDKESEDRDQRIDELEKEVANKDFVIAQQRERLTALEEQVRQLHAELEEWKTGAKKKKTGPLIQ